MELEGLRRSLVFPEDHNIAVELIVTDKHAQISAFFGRRSRA